MSKLHEGQMVLTNGVPLDKAHKAIIMLHGRGASAYDILSLSTYLDQEHIAYLAPQAANSEWYPQRFIEPVEKNEPWLTSALQVVDGLVTQIISAGLQRNQVALLGFSQGACLALEYAARNAGHYAGVFGLSGALIENGDQPREYLGSLYGTPVFLGCSDVDMHIPLARVNRSAEVLKALGATVTERIYPSMGHNVSEDEIEFIRETLKR